MTPSKSIHALVALSRPRIDAMPLRASDAVISISSPDERSGTIQPPSLTGAGSVLWLCFHDVTEPLDTDHGYWLPMQNHHATAIFNFLSRLPSTVARLLIHCDEGRSRSIGVLESLRHFFPHATVYWPDRHPGDTGNLHVQLLIEQRWHMLTNTR